MAIKLSQKIKYKAFWISFFKIVIPFFIFLIIISILFNSFSAVFAGDFELVSKTNFDDGKWIQFFVVKLVIAVFYGFYLTDKNFKK